MVATSDLGSDAERRGGSSPFIRTNATVFFEGVAFFRASKGTRSVGGVSGDLSAVSDVVYCVNLSLCPILSLKINFQTTSAK